MRCTVLKFVFSTTPALEDVDEHALRRNNLGAELLNLKPARLLLVSSSINLRDYYNANLFYVSTLVFGIVNNAALKRRWIAR